MIYHLYMKVFLVSPQFLPFLPGKNPFSRGETSFSLVSPDGRGEIHISPGENQPCPAVNAPQRVYNAQLYIQYNKSSLLLEIDIGTSKLGV